MTAARRYHSTDPRQVVMFDLVAVPLERAPVANDVEPAERTYTRRASSRYERRARRRDPYGFNLPGVEVERSYSLDERPQWVAELDSDGRLKRLVLRLTAAAARKLLAGEELRFRETRLRRAPQLGLFQGRAYVAGQTYSICMILRALGDDSMSGQQRKRLTTEVDALLHRLFEQIWEDHQSEQEAVLRLARIFLGNPEYPIPEWYQEVAVDYRQEILEELTDASRGYVFPDWDL